MARALIVDASAPTRQLWRARLLALGGYEIAESPDPFDAWAQLGYSSFDLVICAWELAGQSGLKLAERIRDEPRFRTVAVVLASFPGADEARKARLAAAAGIDGYLLLPLDESEVAPRLEAALRNRRARARTGGLVMSVSPARRDAWTAALRDARVQPVHAAATPAEARGWIERRGAEIAVLVADLPTRPVDCAWLAELDPVLRNGTLLVSGEETVASPALTDVARAGVTAVLLSPYDDDDLRARIQDLIRRAVAKQLAAEANQFGARAEIAEDWADAEDCFRMALHLAPRDVDASLGLARVLIRKTPPALDEAVQLAKGVTLQSPALDQAYVILAQAFEAGRSLEKAIIILHEGCQSCPYSSDVRLELGRTLLRAGRRERAREALVSALALTPTSDEARRLLDQASQ